MIHDLKRQGLGISAIARRTGLDRKTVRKYLDQGLQSARYGPRQPRPRLLDLYEDYLRDRLTDHAGLSGRRLMREIADLGYAGGYDRRDRLPPRGAARRRRPASNARFETPPEQAGPRSIVYSQYVSWRTVNAIARIRPFVDKAMLACDTLDVDAIRELSTGIIEMATDVFTECIRRLESVEAGAINDSQIAAMHMEEARLLSGELLGTVILDVLCARAVACVDTSKGAPLAFLETVSEIKNHELSGRDSKDLVFKEYDIVDRFYRTASLRSLAEAYQW